MSDDEELLRLAVEVAREAGELASSRRGEGPVPVADTKSSPTDVVTAVDREAEELISRRLVAARPHDGFLGEEGAAGRDGSTGVRWVVDPIDGTVNFLYGIPAYCVSIAAERHGQPVVGVVHNPVTRQTWTAQRGCGAYRNGRPITVGSENRLDHALVGTGFSYTVDRREGQARSVAGLLPMVRDIRRIGSAALDLCLVAQGSLDAYVEQGLNPWDLAAGQLIAAEAGAMVGGLPGEPAGNRLVLAANPELFGALQGLVDELGFGHA